MDSDGSRRIGSIDRAYEIVDTLRRRNGCTLSEVERETALTAGTIHTYLATLSSYGLVVKRGDVYELGPNFVTFGEFVRNETPIYRAGREEIDRLAADTGEAVHLFVEHEGKGIAIYESFGDDAVGLKYHMENRERPRRELHCTAYGKAILAALPEPRVREIIDRHGLEAKTRNTITEVDRLLGELETVRERGYARNDAEEVRGIRGVGAAVLDGTGEVAGGISVSGPVSRIEGETFDSELPERVVEVANLVQVRLDTEDYR